MSDPIDLSAPEHEKARRMLAHELIAWFTTVSPEGRPHAVPVWFFWHDGAAHVFSEPHTVKVRHVRAGSPVLLHLNAGGPFGDDVVILDGAAEVSDRDAASVLADFRDGYLEKYADAIADYGLPIEEIQAKFSAVLVFTPERLLTW
jgi:PPOX class probable F420-dependent enzyme